MGGISVMIFCLVSWLNIAAGVNTLNETQSMGNFTDKDMYVIHAMLYQVGVVTNKTDNETTNFNDAGNQEALTFYHNNGSQIDLSNIPTPLFTNGTAQSLVGVSPLTKSSSQNDASNQSNLKALNRLSNLASNRDEEKGSIRSPFSVNTRGSANSTYEDNMKRYNNIFTQKTLKGTPVAISKGAALIPQSVDVHSIAIPPLITLNNNLSQIPVPIPNTSVVQYAKINTLLNSP